MLRLVCFPLYRGGGEAASLRKRSGVSLKRHIQPYFTVRMLFYLSCVVLTAAVVTGGGTRQGFVADTVLQFLAIPLLCISLWPAFSRESPRCKSARLALGVCGVAALIPFIQLCPLPFSYWAGLSGLLPKGPDKLAAMAGPHTLSITPEATWAAALSLIVPLSIFAAGVQLRLEERIRLSFLLAVLGAVSLALGFLQMLQGPESALRFYAITNPSEAVGFFANRNHFAALLYVTLILAALWLRMTAEETLRQGVFEGRAVLWLAAAAAFLVADVAGLAVARSRAGVFLSIVAFLGIVAWAAFQQTPAKKLARRDLGSSHISLGIALFAFLFATLFGLGSVLSRFESDPFLEDARFSLSQTTMKTALRALPFGTGLGSFTSVYATVESNEHASTSFANRAHNDAAELLLEAGILGAGLLLIFLIWYIRRSYRIWAIREPEGSPPEPALERASSLIIGLLLLHSVVDYPLRTAALATAFSFFCSVLAVPAVRSAEPHGDKLRRSHAKIEHDSTPMEAWQTDTEWPESWKRS